MINRQASFMKTIIAPDNDVKFTIRLDIPK